MCLKTRIPFSPDQGYIWWLLVMAPGTLFFIKEAADQVSAFLSLVFPLLPSIALGDAFIFSSAQATSWLCTRAAAVL